VAKTPDHAKVKGQLAHDLRPQAMMSVGVEIAMVSSDYLSAIQGSAILNTLKG